jgi:hypothetical protein
MDKRCTKMVPRGIGMLCVGDEPGSRTRISGDCQGNILSLLLVL